MVITATQHDSAEEGQKGDEREQLHRHGWWTEDGDKGSLRVNFSLHFPALFM